MKHQPFIVKRRLFLKGGVWVFIWFGASAFTFPFKIRERLARLPYLGKFFKEESPPKNLKEKAHQILEKAYWEGAPFYTPTLWKKAHQYYEKGLQSFSEKNYSHARFYFEKSITYAQKALEETLKKRQNLKDLGEKKFAKIITRWKNIDLSSQERLKWEIRLRYLKDLLEAERYQEFFKEAERIEKELSKLPSKERAQKGPSLKK